MRSKKPENILIQRRLLSHRFTADIPRYWANNNPVITCFFNALSSVIPNGEAFFMRSVKNSSISLQNPDTQASVADFMYQENQHHEAHKAMNVFIASQGFPVNKVEAGVLALLTWVERHFSAQYQLALTVALEHFSCLLSDQFLRQRQLQTHLHPSMRNFLVAHCVEENEHKAVAFDVYQEVYGRYFPRIMMMLFVTLVFAPNVFRIQFVYLLHDKQLTNLSAWLKAVLYFWLKPGWFAQTIPGYLAFYHPRFHPWKRDNSPLIHAYLDDPIFQMNENKPHG